MSDSVDGSRNFTTHPKFSENTGDTDAVIQSSDGVIFHLHWKYLQVNSSFVCDTTDGSQPNEKREKLNLDESSDVLEILFQFIYPRRHPSLEDTGFETLVAVAEAVEKYQVFSAMNLCALRLERFLPCEEHATRIFGHAVKYNYAKLANEAALCLCRRPDIGVVKQLPPAIIIPWLNYRNAWKAVFDTRLRKTMEYPTDTYSCSLSTSSKAGKQTIFSRSVCPSCITSTLAWFQFLENLDRLSDLESSLIALLNESNLPSQYLLDSYRFGKSNFAKFSGAITGGCNSCSKRCRFMSDELQELSKDIKAIPPFTDFLKSD